MPFEQKSSNPNPAIFIGNQLYRSSTFPTESMSQGLPTIDDNDKIPLDELLREHMIQNEQTGFWSSQLLRHILSRNRVRDQLRSYKGLGDAETYLDYICPEVDPLEGSATRTYLKIFALLVLIDKGEEIGNFVKEQVSDQSLPVSRDQNKGKAYLRHTEFPRQCIGCFMKWKVNEREDFETRQWQVLVPYFDLDPQGRARHYSLPDKTILPWRKKGERSSSSSAPSQNDGTYASVSCVKIEPTSHGFHKALKTIHLKGDVFALKRLRDKDFNNEAMFQNELEQLQRFNGLVHDHLVTLLATFRFQGSSPQFSFIFPYADCALDQYWEGSHSEPKFDIATVQWVAKQCSGIMGAIDTIHVPQHLPHLGVMRYGRHGDIKPDNILLFSSSKDPRGILVVSDMGLSTFNRDTSRSNIPNSKIPGVPGYRPPECDVEGGTISRAYDIWTLGCLFLELLTWLLGGLKLINEFEEQRNTVYITGAKNNIFFDLKTFEEDKRVAQVKKEVTQWFDKLHNQPNCSHFIHDTLNIIEKEMLVVLSQDRRRSYSKELRAKFQDIYSKCLNNEDYCVSGVPEPRLFRATTAVLVPLNETAEKTIKEYDIKLPTHEGRKPRNSMLPADLKKIDEIAGDTLDLRPSTK